MGTLDDAIREHLELKRRLGASDEEVKKKETEAFGPGGAAAPAPLEHAPAESEPEFQVERMTPAGDTASEPDPWAPATDEDILEPDEVLPQDALEANGSYAPPKPIESQPEREGGEEPHEDPLDEWDGDEPEPTEDVLRETPEFLEETPEHDRLWFEQNPPQDFDLD
jgi:hypothetical protein